MPTTPRPRRMGDYALNAQDHDLLTVIKTQLEALIANVATLNQTLTLKADVSEVKQWRDDHEWRLRNIEKLIYKASGAIIIAQVAVGWWLKH